MRNEGFERSEDAFFEPDFQGPACEVERIELAAPAVDWRRFLQDAE